MVKRAFPTHELSLYSPCIQLNCCRQLEVLRNNDDGGEKGSLLWLMDHTKTPFGGRLLRNWVAHPLTNRQRINERLDAVEEMVAAGSAMEQGSEPQLRQPSLHSLCLCNHVARNPIHIKSLHEACCCCKAVQASSTADCEHCGCQHASWEGPMLLWIDPPGKGKGRQALARL